MIFGLKNCPTIAHTASWDLKNIKKDHVIAHTASWDLKKTFKKDHVIAHIWPMAVQKRVSHV